MLHIGFFAVMSHTTLEESEHAYWEVRFQEDWANRIVAINAPMQTEGFTALSLLSFHFQLLTKESFPME